MITAVHSILQDKEEFTGKIILCIPVDEEGMMLGIKHFIKQGWADGVDGAIICEPEENNVVSRSAGLCEYEWMCMGKWHMVQFLGAALIRTGEWQDLLSNWKNWRRKSKRDWGKTHILKWPSITPTILQAPVKGDAQINVIPDHCMMTLDIRTVPDQDHDELLDKINAIIDRLKEDDPDFKVELTILDNRPSTITSADDPVVTGNL